MNLLLFRASILIFSWIKNVVKGFESLESNGVLLPFGKFDPVLVLGTDDALVSKRMEKRIICSAPSG